MQNGVVKCAIVLHIVRRSKGSAYYKHCRVSNTWPRAGKVVSETTTVLHP